MVRQSCRNQKKISAYALFEGILLLSSTTTVIFWYFQDNTIEMYDIKNKRKFLNRTRLGEMPPCLLIGTKLSIHARQHCIVDYGDDKTRKEHTGLNETSCGIIKHQKYIGKIITNVMNNDLKVKYWTKNLDYLKTWTNDLFR